MLLPEREHRGPQTRPARELAGENELLKIPAGQLPGARIGAGRQDVEPCDRRLEVAAGRLLPKDAVRGVAVGGGLGVRGGAEPQATVSKFDAGPEVPCALKATT